MKRHQINTYISFILLLTLGCNQARASTKDTLLTKQEKLPKHFIKPCIYYNGYGTGDRELHQKNARFPNQFDSYNFKQSNIGFYTPLYTTTWLTPDSTALQSFQVIGNGNVSQAILSSSILIHDRTLNRYALGVKGIYTDGAKNSLFLAIAPFSSFDQYGKASNATRLAFQFIYNRTVSPDFSYRLGFMKTYIFGRGLPLPIIGFRVGRMDAVHLNVQLLRNISLDMPTGKHLYFSLFTRPIGSEYLFKNELDTTVAKKGKYIDFARWELLTGLQVNYNPTRNVSFFAALGSSKGWVTMASHTNKLRLRDEAFEKFTLQRQGFLNIGVTIYFGKSRNIAGNYQMYDAIDMNNQYGNDDNNVNINNDQIPLRSKTIQAKNLQYNDIKDLIQETDLQ